MDPHLIIQAVHDAAEAFLHDRVSYARDRWPDLEVHGSFTQLDPREALVAAASSAHLVVLGSRGRGPLTSMLGSVSVWTSKRAACPVAICRPSGGSQALRHGVLVGVDGTRANAPAVELAFQLAAERDGDLTVLHCVYEVGGVSRDLDLWEDEAQRLVAESVAGLREKYPDVNAKLRVAVGLVDATLADASAEYEAAGPRPTTAPRVAPLPLLHHRGRARAEHHDRGRRPQPCRDLRRSAVSTVSTSSRPSGAVVVGVAAENTTSAIRWAVEEARARQLPLHLVHAYGTPGAILTNETHGRVFDRAEHALDAGHRPRPRARPRRRSRSPVSSTASTSPSTPS